MNKLILHSGGAKGADSKFDEIGKSLDIWESVNHYYRGNKTSLGNVQQSDSDFYEGRNRVKLANKTLGRYGIDRYMNLLARSWNQVKYSEAVYAISRLQNSYKVEGGTGWACQMAIDWNKPLYVFDMKTNKWYRWNGNKFEIMDSTPIINAKDIAGIGSRELTESGINAIHELLLTYKLNNQ